MKKHLIYTQISLLSFSKLKFKNIYIHQIFSHKKILQSNVLNFYLIIAK